MGDELRTSNELTVSFTLKEVLLRIESEIREIRGAFSGRVEAQDAKIDVIDKRVTAIELEKTHRNAFRDNWQAWVALIAAIAAGVGAVLAVVHIHG